MGGPGLAPGRPILLFCPEAQTIAPANLDAKPPLKPEPLAFETHRADV
jgi:hypothetical protein